MTINERFKPTTEDITKYIDRETIKNFVAYCARTDIISVDIWSGGLTRLYDSLARAGICSIDTIRDADFYKIASTRRQFGKLTLENCLAMQKFIKEFKEEES